MDKIIKKYLAYVSDRINNWDYTDIDAFCEDDELTDGEIEIILDLPLEVVKQGVIERLKKDLDKYGVHYRSCEVVKYPNAECTCGFEQALKGGG